ncbi:phage minor tail protein L [Pokkaliibacter sp. CJK22405]|uniref:phage minor tail protein L n=1 Tax=Pokkaliibacter sp. CJK22405 TaxID=3384615 RepID=UPI003984F645
MSEIIARESQQLEQDAIVELFEIDATAYGQGTLRWTTGPIDGEPVMFGGVEFAPMPIKAEGFSWSGQGSIPQPTLTVSAINPAVIALVIGNNDILGCEVRRLCTFARHLDQGSDPDPDALFPVDHYTVSRKTSHTRESIEFQLAAKLDQQGIKLPRRKVLKGFCSHSYRYWDSAAGVFRYENVTCPYSGEGCWNPQGEAVAAADDECGRKLSDCKLRFGSNGILPTRAFPGVKRYS